MRRSSFCSEDRTYEFIGVYIAPHPKPHIAARRFSSAAVNGPFIQLSVCRGCSSVTPLPACTSRITNQRLLNAFTQCSKLRVDCGSFASLCESPSITKAALLNVRC